MKCWLPPSKAHEEDGERKGMNGPEAYSLAITLREHMTHFPSDLPRNGKRASVQETNLCMSTG